MAVKIKVRAVDRAGELLKQCEAAKNQHDARARAGTGAGTRTQMAQNAGLSKHQQVAAVRVHNVPRDQFEEMVERENPTTVTVRRRAGIVTTFQCRKRWAEVWAGCATRL